METGSARPLTSVAPRGAAAKNKSLKRWRFSGKQVISWGGFTDLQSQRICEVVLDTSILQETLACY